MIQIRFLFFKSWFSIFFQTRIALLIKSGSVKVFRSIIFKNLVLKTLKTRLFQLTIVLIKGTKFKSCIIHSSIYYIHQNSVIRTDIFMWTEEVNLSKLYYLYKIFLWKNWMKFSFRCLPVLFYWLFSEQPLLMPRLLKTARERTMPGK